jgi:hypothetical protein
MLWLLGFLVATIATIYAGLQHREDGKLPPELPEVMPVEDRRSKAHVHFANWARHYGDVFSYKLGSKPAVVLNSIQAMEELLVKRGGVYSSRPRATTQVVTGRSRIIALPYGDQFRV